MSVDSRHLKPNTALVLGTIRHEDARILELVLEGEESAPLGVTPAHPLYSADRGQWVPAGEVQVGERLWTHHGSIATVTEVLDERRRETVYNLEVHRAQSYFVGPQRLLAHNTDLDDCKVIDERNARHIFRDSEGHLPDTPGNRKRLTDMATKESNFLGEDKWGNKWFAETNSDGSQTWASVRGNQITNGGVNSTSKKFHPETELSAPKKPSQK